MVTGSRSVINWVAQTGKLVKRGITRILAGTVLEDQLEATSNHFLMAVSVEKKQLVASWLDLYRAI